MKCLYVSLLILLAACNSGQRISQSASNKILNDSTARVSSLEERTDKGWVYYITPAGKKILLQRLDQQPATARASSHRIAEDSVDVPVTTGLASHASADDVFGGTIRVKPKTNYSEKTYKKYRTIPALYRKLESNEFMKDLGIGNSEERVEQEERNIILEKAYLYTITLEDDNDLHLLIGNTPVFKEGKTRVFNAEISGVPPSGTAAQKQHMKDLREKAINEMNDIPLCGHSGYLQANRRIKIRGSLFFDSHHATKPAKCREVEGESAWEIHPVFDIEFFD